jgi:hypothetical protein
LKKYWFLSPISYCSMILLLQSLTSISEQLPVPLDPVASKVYRHKVPTLFMGRYRNQPDGPILPKSWVAALHVTTRGSKLLQKHQREGQPPLAQPPADEEAEFRLWLVENKLNPHSIKSESANHWLPCYYSTRDRSLGRTFFYNFWGGRKREIRFSKENEHNFRAVFTKKTIFIVTKIRWPSWSGQNACVWQLRDPEFTFCKFVTKLHIRVNFIDQLGIFLLSNQCI